MIIETHSVPRFGRTAGLGVTVLLLLVTLCGLLGGPGSAFDVMIDTALFHFRTIHPAMTQLAIAVTWSGSAIATMVAVGLLCLVLALAPARRRRVLAYFAMVIAVRLSVEGLKLLIARPRPSLDLHPVPTSSSSFPSGHAANSMAAFVGLALLLAPPRWRPQAVAFATALSLLVGSTRPYLGVHWPSDVLAGWALAAAIIVATARWYRNDGSAASGYSTASPAAHPA